MKYSKRIVFVLAVVFIALPFFCLADYGGQQTIFFVDSSYDLLGRSQITATLIRITPSLYFYLENNWWNSLDNNNQQQMKIALQNLGNEFENKIYPELTKTFGSEPRPGIDDDVHITVLFHPMKQESAGYINTANQYDKLQSPISNQREMVYLNTAYLTTDLIKGYLSHEFMHLITFNQKQREHNISEEIWLNEARAEYAATFLGYDNLDFQNSNLKKRVSIFSKYPNDPLTEWTDNKSDYGVLNLFTQYLVEQYGIEILADSLKSDKIGILSLEQALADNGFEQKFADIFTDWTVVNIVNNCSVLDQNGQTGRYCYKNRNLRNLRIVPRITFLSFSADSHLALTAETKDWQANWFKVIGGRGDLKIQFAGFSEVSFQVPYLIIEKSGVQKVGFLEIDSFQNGELDIDDFGSLMSSITIMPSIQNKKADFSSSGRAYPFFWSVNTELALPTGRQAGQNGQQSSAANIQVLVKKIDFLEKQLAALKAQLAEMSGIIPSPPVISPDLGIEPRAGLLNRNMRIGERSKDVQLLQTWLAQDKAIYPQGYITGYFGPLTKAAIIRFQEKYSEEVLVPWGLTLGNGFVGSKTRAKLNQLYGE